MQDFCPSSAFLVVFPSLSRGGQEDWEWVVFWVVGRSFSKQNRLCLQNSWSGRRGHTLMWPSSLS